MTTTTFDQVNEVQELSDAELEQVSAGFWGFLFRIVPKVFKFARSLVVWSLADAAVEQVTK